MNREILFKGQRKSDREWIYGNLLRTDDGIFIIQNHVPYHLLAKYEVIEKTVCQYTGLTDKDGMKIFEKDIVSASFIGYAGKTKERKGAVEFVNGAFSVNWNDSEEYGKNFVGYVHEIKVIGNIFDKQEILKETNAE